MQETLIHDTDLEKLVRHRKEKYTILMNELNLLAWRKKEILDNYYKETLLIDKNILIETKKERIIKNDLKEKEQIKKQKWDN